VFTFTEIKPVMDLFYTVRLDYFLE